MTTSGFDARLIFIDDVIVATLARRGIKTGSQITSYALARTRNYRRIVFQRISRLRACFAQSAVVLGFLRPPHVLNYKDIRETFDLGSANALSPLSLSLSVLYCKIYY